jgi:hypothetical protein
MKYLLLILCVSTSTFADNWKDKTYIAVGAGWKFHEAKIYYHGKQYNDPISARIEISYEYSKHITFGVSHHSQWLTGFPVNTDKEPAKTELFIDYTFSISDLLK